MASHFIKIPPQGASASDALCYVFEQEQTALTLDVEIIETGRGSVLGRLRFYNTRHIECDIAPCLRHLAACSPLPQISPTGVYPAIDREIEVELKVAASIRPDDPSQPIMFHEERSPARRYVFAECPVTGNEIRTSLPSQRITSQNDLEEILFHCTAPLRITVVTQRLKESAIRYFEVKQGGLHIFCLNCAEFPQAEKISVEIGSLGRIEYNVVRRPRGSVRMAWESRYGSVERYTFPTVQLVERRCEEEAPDRKRRSGLARTLRSAFENRAMMEGLSEIIASEEAWMVGSGGTRPVRLACDRFKVHEHGSLSFADIVICPTSSDPKKWS